MRRLNLILGGGLFFCLFLTSSVSANNLNITNVSFEDRDNSQNTAIVEFDINWDNSWSNAENHDAIWVFLKVDLNTVGIYHGMMDESGINPTGTAYGSNGDLEIYVPPDLTGAFIRRKGAGLGTAQSKDVRLKLDYGASPLSSPDTTPLTVQVIGIEMVFVPTLTFRVGDGTSTATLKEGSSDTDPWSITSEATLGVKNVSSNGFYYTSAANTGEDATGSTFTLLPTFPKGYQSFYCMKYELTEGQWVAFINTLSTAEKDRRDITSSTNSGKNSDSVVKRNTVSYTSSGATATTDRPDRAVNYLSWMDLCAYLDWAALRPMTELEFEKASRGPLSPVAGEYAWGSTSITAAVTISMSPELGLEVISTASANCAYNVTTFSRGDDFLGSAYTEGPLRVGIFATASSTRATSGAGYYGAMELSGNIEERVVTIGNATGRLFTGLHGDGILDLVDAPGDANVTGWPGHDGTSVSGGTGSGRKTGSWTNSACSVCEISDRTIAADPISTRNSAFGGRGVRTYTGP